ncbi:MAG TPA: alpha/beta fold hydrolase [Burkholderiaceae bacterium]|nr:alpha/beta fold hydrolase [Burkholderiaceae bacterium]
MQVSTPRVTLEVEDIGARDAPVVLLIMGLGMQLVAWPDAFVAALVGDGMRVVRFDNRDCGLSQAFDELRVPPIGWEMTRRMFGLPVRAPYPLEAMSDDAVALLDALRIARAHVCGVSMGGMIGQLMALDRPERVASLALAMTTSGARHLPPARPDAALAILSRPRGRDLESLVKHGVRLMRTIGSPAYPTPPEVLEARVRRAYERSVRPKGMLRQLLAVTAAPDRTPRLARLTLPVHIVHGEADPLVPVEHGRQLARTLPAASAEFIAGMGHDLPDVAWQALRRAIARAALGADR